MRNVTDATDASATAAVGNDDNRILYMKQNLSVSVSLFLCMGTFFSASRPNLASLHPKGGHGQ